MNVLNQDELIDKTLSGNIPIDDLISIIIKSHIQKKILTLFQQSVLLLSDMAKFPGEKSTNVLPK